MCENIGTVHILDVGGKQLYGSF